MSFYAFMDSQETLIHIASASKRVVATLIHHTDRKTVESLRLDKILVGSGAALETLNKVLFLKDGVVDDRLADWLASGEPQACLHTLNRMERILNRKPSHGGGNFFRGWSSRHTQDMSNEAMRLFRAHQSLFHFLLMPTDVWNRESDAQRSQALAQQGALCVQEENDNRDLGRVTERKSGGGKAMKQGVNAEKLKSILGWLNPWNCKEIHRRTTLLRQPGTCVWLPNTNVFKTWRSTKDSFLWLHGKVGAGKSVLAASVIGNLKNTLKDDETLAFFYCDFRNERSTSAAEVMRSLLSQLLEQFDWKIVDHGDLIGELAKGRDEDTLIISDVMLLAHYVSRVAEQFSQHPLVVIDALDECRDVEDLLDALRELAKGGLRLLVTSRPLQVIKESLSDHPLISMDTMKYEVSADIELHVMRELDSHRRLRIVDDNLKKEIYSTLSWKADGMFRWVQCQLDILKGCMTTVRVREALNDLPRDLDATYERILLEIDKVEEGEVVRRALEWLVAALVPLQLSQIMESLSIDLGRQVLDHESGPVHGPALLDALGSLVTYNELTDVVTLSHFSVEEYLTGQSVCTKYPTYYINQQAAHTQLVLLCMCYIVAYLKRVQQSSGHEAPSSGTYRTQICRGDHNIATPCTTGRPIVSFQSSLTYPLLEYVLYHGFHHLSYTNPRNRAVLQAIVDLQRHAQRHPAEWERLCEKTYSSPIPWPTSRHDLALYVLIAFAPESLLHLYLRSVELKLKDRTNPLIYSAYFSKLEHSRILLARDISLNRRGWNVYSTCQCLPIEVAVERRDWAVVDLFLKVESPVPHGLFVRALEEKCIFPGCNVARLLQTDEFIEWAADIRDKELLLRALNPARYRSHPCYRPSEQDIDVIQRRLIQIDCDPCTRFNEKSLRSAVAAGHISTVKHMLSLNFPLPHDIILDASRGANSNSNLAMMNFLLGLGSNIHVISPNGDTPVHLIMKSYLLTENDCLEGVQILVDSGCNPSRYNFAGETPLHLATRLGYISVIKYLLTFQVELPADILLATAGSNMASTMRFLISKGADVHAIAANGDTPLHVVLGKPYGNLNESLECADILVNTGCNPCLLNALGETSFDVAAKNASPMVLQYLLSLNRILLPPGILLSVCANRARGMSLMIELLINKGADIHRTCLNGDTPLHLSMRVCSEAECLSRLETLVNAGCDPRAPNLAGDTPFHVAASRGYILVMESLISIGISAPFDVMLALLRRCHSLRYYPTIRFLLDKGVDTNIVGEDGRTLLHFAAALIAEDDALEVVKLLVNSGCDPFALNLAQETPLHIAARHGHASVVDHLLSLDTPFLPDVLLAASDGYYEKTQVIRYLVDRGADTSVVTTDGDTPLHLLLANGEEMDRLESVKILIDAGCDPCSQNLAGETPLHIAARSGFVTILEYLVSRGVSFPHDILRTSSLATIRFLLNKGTDACSASIDGDKELMHRALSSQHPKPYEKDYLDCAQTLVGLGWDPSLGNSSGETPMHIATRHGLISVVKYLLSQGVPLPADVLLVAVSTEDTRRLYRRVVELTRFLICEGAGVNITGPNGDTPLHLALLRCNFNPDRDHYDRKESWEIVEILLNSGSDPAARNADGQTLFDLAEAQGHFFKENFLRLVRNSRVHRPRMSA